MAFAQIYGGITVLGSEATILSSETVAMCQITIRTLTQPTTSRVYFGNVNVTPGGDNAHGYIDPGEAYTWGPYSRGGGIRPAQIFLAGPAGATVLWSAWPA